MPAPEVTCSICGQTVLKARTCFIGDGKRACKDHDGVKGKAAWLQEEEKKKKEREEAARQDKIRRKTDPHYIYNPDVECCWFCNTPGIKAQTFFWKMLKESKRVELETGKVLNYFFPDEAAMSNLQDRFVGREKICLFPIQKNMIPEGIRKQIRFRFQPLSEMVGFVFMCPTCIEKWGLKKLAMPEREIPLETLHLIGALVDEELTKQVKAEN